MNSRFRFAVIKNGERFGWGYVDVGPDENQDDATMRVIRWIEGKLDKRLLGEFHQAQGLDIWVGVIEI